MYPSLLRHWATIVRSPSPQVLRQVAVLFDAPIQDVLIAAGYMTEEENRPLSPTRMSLQQMSNKQILDEIRRRTVRDTGRPPIPVESTEYFTPRTAGPAHLRRSAPRFVRCIETNYYRAASPSHLSDALSLPRWHGKQIASGQIT